MRSKVLWVGFSSIFVIVGLAVTIFGVLEVLKAQASASWPGAPGIIVASEMSEHYDSDSGTTYSADIAYTFQVAATSYRGDQIKIGEVSTSDADDARHWLNKYPVGAEVLVYYDPAKPGESVLEPGVHASTFFLPGFGFVFATFGALFVCVGLFADE